MGWLTHLAIRLDRTARAEIGSCLCRTTIPAESGKGLWERIEPWLSVATHFHVLVVQTGFGALIVTGVVGLVFLVLAWLHRAPAYQIGLIVLGAVALFLLVANQSLRLVTTWKVPSSISRQQARRLDRTDPGGIRLGGSAAFVITMLASACIIVAGIYAESRYSQWQSDTNNTYLQIIPGNVKPYVNDDNPFKVNVNVLNFGPIEITDAVHNQEFKNTPNILSEDEETAYMAGVVAELAYVKSKNETGISIGRHEIRWFTWIDDGINTKTWKEFEAGKMFIYYFVNYRYQVSGYDEFTEYCVFFQNTDFPSFHECHDHDKRQWK